MRLAIALKNKGRYVLVCFGSNLIDQQRRKAVKNVRDAFKRAGYARARVDVWGQSELSGLISTFPSLLMRLSDTRDLPFRTFADWRLGSVMARAMNLRN